MATRILPSPKVVSRDAWLAARTALLAKERAMTHALDALRAERRRLPWVKIDKPYVFDGPQGKCTLADLFRGRSQLYVKHFMMGPGAQHQCVGCSLEVDHVEGILAHLENHDVSYAVVARAPFQEIEVVRKRMGWKFLWVSSFGGDFNYDFNVSFKPEEVASGHAQYNFGTAPEWAAGMQDLSGRSVFYKNEAGQIFHSRRRGEQGAQPTKLPDVRRNLSHLVSRRNRGLVQLAEASRLPILIDFGQLLPLPDRRQCAGNRGKRTCEL